MDLNYFDSKLNLKRGNDQKRRLGQLSRAGAAVSPPRFRWQHELSNWCDVGSAQLQVHRTAQVYSIVDLRLRYNPDHSADLHSIHLVFHSNENGWFVSKLEKLGISLNSIFFRLLGKIWVLFVLVRNFGFQEPIIDSTSRLERFSKTFCLGTEESSLRYVRR